MSHLQSFEEFVKTHAKEKQMSQDIIRQSADTQRLYQDYLSKNRKYNHTTDTSQYVKGFEHLTNYINVGNKSSIGHNNKLLYFNAPNFNRFEKAYPSPKQSQYGTIIDSENSRKWYALGSPDNQNSLYKVNGHPLGLYGKPMSMGQVKKIMLKEPTSVVLPEDYAY